MVHLFWNLGRRVDCVTVARLVAESGASIVVLAERRDSADETVRALNRESSTGTFHFSWGACPRLDLYSCFEPSLLSPIEEREHWTIRSVQAGKREVILAAAHLPSKLRQTAASQRTNCEIFARAIRNAEQSLGHNRSIAVGDFNVNPFEEGMISTVGLHAVASRAEAAKGSRRVQGQDYPFFYNPMWSPVTLVTGSAHFPCHSAREFGDRLGDYLSSPATRHVIATLMAKAAQSGQLKTA